MKRTYVLISYDAEDALASQVVKTLADVAHSMLDDADGGVRACAFGEVKALAWAKAARTVDDHFAEAMAALQALNARIAA